MTPISSPWLLCSIKISFSRSGEKYASNPLSPNVSSKHVFLAGAPRVRFDAAFALCTFIASRPFILQFCGGFSSWLWICKAAPEQHGQQSGTEISILLFLNQTRHIGFYYRECSYLRMNSAGEQQQAGRQTPRKTGTSEREGKGKKKTERDKTACLLDY